MNPCNQAVGSSASAPIQRWTMRCHPSINITSQLHLGFVTKSAALEVQNMRLSWVGAVGDGGEAPIGVTVSSPTSEEGLVGVVVDGVSSLVMIQIQSELARLLFLFEDD